MAEGVLAGRGATWVEDELVPLHRRGRLEEAYFTFSYSPVRSEDGAIEGVMDIATETTPQVIDRRRLETLNELGSLLAGLERVDDVAERALPLLRANAVDLPGVEITGAEEPDGTPEVAGATGWARLPIGSGRTLVVRLSERL